MNADDGDATGVVSGRSALAALRAAACVLSARSLPGETGDMAKVCEVQADMLSESLLSFNTIHDPVRRRETGRRRDGTWLGDGVLVFG